MTNFLSTQESKLRVVLTIALFIVSVIGTIVIQNDMHQAYAMSAAVTAVLVQALYWVSDYDAPF